LDTSPEEKFPEVYRRFWRPLVPASTSSGLESFPLRIAAAGDP